MFTPANGEYLITTPAEVLTAKELGRPENISSAIFWRVGRIFELPEFSGKTCLVKSDFILLCFENSNLRKAWNG